MITMQVLFTLYQRALLSRQDPQMVKQPEEYTRKLESACDEEPKEKVELASGRMEDAIKSLDVIGKIKPLDEWNSQISEFKVFWC